MSKKISIADYLPEEIILQILHKLPIKPLVQCTCVSKSWLSLIKNPSFISIHLNNSISSSNKNPLLLLYHHSYTASPYSNHYPLYLDNEEYNHYMDLRFPFRTRDQKYSPYFRVVGAMNGLICVCDISFGCCTIIIWNPWIKKSVTLPKPISTCYVTHALGFGFDSRSNDYKVLRLAKPKPSREEEKKPDDGHYEFEVYSLNTNSWKEICAPRYKIHFHDRHVFVNGVLHLLVLRRVTDGKDRNLILGFDVGDEEFKEITLPESLADATFILLNVLVYKESIAVFQFSPDGSHVWVMEKYGVVESWTKVFTFNGQEGRVPLVFRFRKNGELFFHIRDGGMVSCQLESREIKRLGVHENYFLFDYFVESMELLDNANAQSDPTVENDAIGDAIGDAADDAIGDAIGDAAGDAIGDAAGDAAGAND